MSETIHYNTTRLHPKEKVDLLNRAYALCTTWWVDILDCSKSFRRQRIDMSYEEIMSKYTGSDLHVIHRCLKGVENHLEVGFRIFDDTCDYFLWLILDPVHIPEIESMLI